MRRPPSGCAAWSSTGEPVLAAWLLGWGDLFRRPQRIIPTALVGRGRARAAGRPGDGGGRGRAGRTCATSSSADATRSPSSARSRSGLRSGWAVSCSPGVGAAFRAAAWTLEMPMRRTGRGSVTRLTRSRVHPRGPGPPGLPCYTPVAARPRARPARLGGPTPPHGRDPQHDRRHDRRLLRQRRRPVCPPGHGRLHRHPVARLGLLGLPRHAAAEREPGPARTWRPRSSSCSRRSCSCSASSSTGSSGPRRRSARSTSATWPRRPSSPRWRRSRPARPATSASTMSGSSAPTAARASTASAPTADGSSAWTGRCARGAAGTSSAVTSRRSSPSPVAPATSTGSRHPRPARPGPDPAALPLARPRGPRRAGAARRGPSRSLDPGPGRGTAAAGRRPRARDGPWIRTRGAGPGRGTEPGPRRRT